MSIDQGHYVKYSHQKFGNLVGYGQMEYMAGQNNKVAVLVHQCKDKKSIEKCFNEAKSMALKNAKEIYQSAYSKDISCEGIMLNELLIDDEIRGSGYYFFWKHDSLFIIQVGHVSPTTSENNMARVVEKITSVSIPIAREGTIKDDAVISGCSVGIFGFPMTQSVTPADFVVRVDGGVSVTLVNNFGGDVTIRRMNGQGLHVILAVLLVLEMKLKLVLRML